MSLLPQLATALPFAAGVTLADGLLDHCPVLHFMAFECGLAALLLLWGWCSCIFFSFRRASCLFVTAAAEHRQQNHVPVSKQRHLLVLMAAVAMQLGRRTANPAKPTAAGAKSHGLGACYAPLYMHNTVLHTKLLLPSPSQHSGRPVSAPHSPPTCQSLR